MELLTRHVVGVASTDPAYMALLWDPSVSHPYQQLCDSLTDAKSPYGLLQQLVLPEYKYRGGEC
jgi:hypothetical protein